LNLLIEIGKKMSGNGSMEFIDKQGTHKVEKFRWDERGKEEFLDIMNSNVNEICMQGIKHFLQKIRLTKLIIYFFFR
jgi:hypothetical protein